MKDQVRESRNCVRMFAPSGRACEVKVLMVQEATEGPCCQSRVSSLDFYRRVVVRSAWFDPDKEAVVVLLLNQRHWIKGYNLVTLGTVSSSLIAPREVYRAAVAGAASSVVLMHNHPSGDPQPSEKDNEATALVSAAGRVLGIGLLDHVIVGERSRDPIGLGYYSYFESGKLPAT